MEKGEKLTAGCGFICKADLKAYIPVCEPTWQYFAFPF